MPTTRLKNTLYRLALPVKAPRLYPELTAKGDPLSSPDAFLRLLRMHHVMGSATLLKDQSHRSVLLCSSRNPDHSVFWHSMFRVASITKMATALAALRAAEEGMLALDLPVLSYFPQISSLPDLQDVTLLHLLSHTSGLMDPPDMESALIQEKTFPEIVLNTRQSAPGTEFHYSNLGFGLIGSLLEAVYSKPVSKVLKNLVFSPLGMNATLDASELLPAQIVPITRVFPYHSGKDLVKTPLGERPLTKPDPLRHYGHTAGAMYLDLPSLEKLTDCLMRNGQPILKTDLGQVMIRKHAEYGQISPTLSYGLGILRIQDRSLSDSLIFGHQGFAYGCADGAFWENGTNRMVLFLNGGASEARKGRLGLCNYDLLKWAFRKEMPQWSR